MRETKASIRFKGGLVLAALAMCGIARACSSTLDTSQHAADAVGVPLVVLWFVPVSVIVGLILTVVILRKRSAEREQLATSEQLAQSLAQWNATQAAQAEAAAHARWQQLVARFGEEIGGRILRREIWQGQTSEMLLEARGQPAGIDETVMKTKTKHVFKYGFQGANRYAVRVMLENSVVVGWEA